MAEVHSHSHADERSSYYLDQLFMIGVCGAIAGVTIMLWQSGALGSMLHQKFHIWVALGGISLLIIVFLRAVAVWRSVDEQADTAVDPDADCGHSHGHGPDCGHDHGGTSVQPVPGGGGVASLAVVAAPAGGHSHAHAHSHSHAHSHANGHDHGWAPWRYVVLLLPVVLYFLVLSNANFNKELVDRASGPLQYIHNFIVIFRSIVWEAMPFIVLGALIAGFLEELLPQGLITRILPRNPFIAICVGGFLGLLFPMCECGIIPIMRRLLRKGLPLSCCIAYLLAGPIVNLVVLLSTMAAFSGMENVFEGGEPSYQMGAFWMTLFRAGLGYLVAVVTAFVVEWQYRRHGNSLLTPLARSEAVAPKQRPLGTDLREFALYSLAVIPLAGIFTGLVWFFGLTNVLETLARGLFVVLVVFLGGLAAFLVVKALILFASGPESRRRLWEHATNISETALHDFVDITVFLILGALLAATVRMFLTSEQVGTLGQQYWLLAIVLMMGLAVALCLCSEADAFVAASFVTLRPSAKVAFLVLGPMLDFKLYAMYTRIFRPRLIFTIYACLISQVFIYSVAVHFFWEKYAPVLITPQRQVEPLSDDELQAQGARSGIATGMLGLPVPGAWHPASFAASWAMVAGNVETQIPEMSFLRLESAAASPELRDYYKGKLFYMTGRFSGDERRFTLLRYKINCCVADATPLRAALYVNPDAKQTLNVNKLSNQWVKVIGHVQFMDVGGSYVPALVVTPTERQSLDELVKIVPLDGNPYLY
jgi:uncharacterized membrane protein YraQ (UPF0718 family)